MATAALGQDPAHRPVIERPYELPPLPADRCYIEDPDPDLWSAGALMLDEDSDLYDIYQFRMSEILYSGHTAFQRVVIGRTLNYGVALFLDGAIQSSEDDEELYHELLVQPALLAHPRPRDVLIIGGGEGATLREVLAHHTVGSATMCDIDGELVDLCRQYMPYWNRGAFFDSRARLVTDDGRKFVREDDGLYDVAIIDIVDMLDNGPAQALYTRQFYELLKTRLRPGAIVAVQGMEFSILDDKQHAALSRTLRSVFAEVHSYQAVVPSFLGNWGFLLASDWFAPQEWTEHMIDGTIESRLGAQWLSHMNGEFLKGCFAMCKEQRFLLSQPGPILEDGVAFIAPPYIDDVEPPNVQLPAVQLS
jgi:spermidine synthase